MEVSASVAVSCLLGFSEESHAIGSCLWTHHCINRNLYWDESQFCQDLFFLSPLSIFFTAVLLDRNVSVSEILIVWWQYHCRSYVLSFYWMWTLQVPTPHCWTFHLWSLHIVFLYLVMNFDCMISPILLNMKGYCVLSNTFSANEMNKWIFEFVFMVDYVNEFSYSEQSLPPWHTFLN